MIHKRKMGRTIVMDFVVYGSESNRLINPTRWAIISLQCFKILRQFQGIPFEPDDAMFNPPVSSRLSQYESLIPQQDPQQPTVDPLPNTLTPVSNQDHSE
jgi:hypothetical protein